MKKRVRELKLPDILPARKITVEGKGKNEVWPRDIYEVLVGETVDEWAAKNPDGVLVLKLKDGKLIIEEYGIEEGGKK